MRLLLVPGSWELAATSNSGSNERASSEVAPTSGSTMSTCSLPRSTRPHFNLLRPRRVSRAEAPGRPFCRVAHDDTCGSGACPGLHQRWRSPRTRVRLHAPQALENQSVKGFLRALRVHCRTAPRARPRIDPENVCHGQH